MSNEQSHSEKFEELCAGYVLNALDEEERREFERMLADASDEEQRLYEKLSSAANQLAFTIEKSEPSADVKSRLMQQIKDQEETELKTGGSSTSETSISGISSSDDQSAKEGQWSAFAVAASFVLLIVSLSLIFYAFNLHSEINQKVSVIDEQQTQITELKNELSKKEEMLSILEAREVDMVLMSGLEVNPNGYGKIIWDPQKQQALLQVSNLPAVPSDKDYQLWLIKNNTPISAGVFSVNNQSDKFFKIEQMAQVNEQSASAFAITMEPKGGMPQPTGDMYLMGNMKK